MRGVESKVVVITGASSGIGEATAKLLAQNGAKVVLGARRGERLERLAYEIGENAAWLQSDVSKLEDMQARGTCREKNSGEQTCYSPTPASCPAATCQN